MHDQEQEQRHRAASRVEIRRRIRAGPCLRSSSLWVLLRVRSEAALGGGWGGLLRAGHEPGLLLDGASGAIQELYGEVMVLGIMPNEAFEECSVPFANPGSVLVVTTDGITEAMNGSDDMFGRERLMESLLKYAQLSAQGILDGILADVATFSGGYPQNDDVTLAILKRT